mgnify:CR=1 FL=1
MLNTKMTMGEYVLFSIPVEMLQEAGIGEESVVQMSAGKLMHRLISAVRLPFTVLK